MRYTVVFDTNILIAALLPTKGNPFRCLALARIGQVESVTFKGSPQVIARLALIFPAPATAQSLVITAKLTLGRHQGGRSMLQAVA